MFSQKKAPLTSGDLSNHPGSWSLTLFWVVLAPPPTNTGQRPAKSGQRRVGAPISLGRGGQGDFGTADLPSREEQLPMIKREQTELRAYWNGNMSQSAHLLVTEWDDYVNLSRNVREEIALGEASVSCLSRPNAAPAIRSKLP